MKEWKVFAMLFVALTLAGPMAEGRESRKRSKKKSATPAVTQTKQVSESAEKLSGEGGCFYQLEVSHGIWREDIEATRANGTEKGLLSTHFSALQVQGNYLTPFKKNASWAWTYSAALAIGTAKGTVVGDFADIVANQKWTFLSFSPGILRRVTEHNELGLRAAFVYRLIFWDLDSGSGVEIDRENSFSYGLTGVYVHRFTPKSSLVASLTSYISWSTTQWSLGYQYDWR